MTQSVRIAVDIGGTFTDLQILDEASGQTHSHKTPTTPNDPSEGLLRGILEASERFNFGLEQVSGLMHGTTIATNAVLERKLAKGALITTAGFEDVLEIGRHVRKDIYSLKAEPRTLLIPRKYRFGITERMTAQGKISESLDEKAALAIIPVLRQHDIEAVAICLLHAYANPSHEQRLLEIFQTECPQLQISLSSAISPEIREFERTSTTVLNALLMPVVNRYLNDLEHRLAAVGFKAPVYLVQSNGGVTTPALAAEQPARLLLSGPSGGALAAKTLSQALSEPNLIAADMGGTSFDVSLIHNGTMRLITQGEVADCPVRLPMVEIRTIGAGGGSIARVDEAGRLHVGPESAGAEPGPVAYGRGGTEPTVTDANATLGRLDPGYFLGGAMRLDITAAQHCLSESIAKPLQLSTEIAAEGVLQVATAKMAAAIRLSLFEKGLDPEDFALLAFGGAGGLQAIEVATELGIQRVIFPRDPGTLSAWGMLFADVNHDLARSYLTPALPDAVTALAQIATELRQRGANQLERDGIAEKQRGYQFALDMRYPGQAYEILTPWLDASATVDSLEQAIGDFHALHETQYAHADATVIPEIVTVRLSAIGRLSKPGTGTSLFSKLDTDSKQQHRRLYLTGEWHEVPVTLREQMAASIVGPALIEEPHSTLLLPAGWTLDLAPSGDLIAQQKP